MKKIIVLFTILFCSNEICAQSQLDTLPYLRGNKNIYSLIVFKNEKPVYKKYFNDYNEQSLFNDQSLTKSVVALLTGIAIDKGYIPSVDEKIIDYFPELKNDSELRKREVTIREIMNQASGLYHEDLARLDLFLQVPDTYGYVLKQPMVADPGTVWHYSNAATHLLSVILTKATGMQTHLFAEKMLFQPLGITGTGWKKMPDGYDDGSGLLSMRLHTNDLVKIGELILQHGVWNGKRVISEKWINDILHPAIFYKSYWGFPGSDYALCFYHFTYKGTDITYGMGWGGQFLVIIPSANAVIAINQNIADANAIKQSNAFIEQVFPVLFEMIEE